MKTPLIGNVKCESCGIKDRGKVKYDRKRYIYFECAHCGEWTYYTDDGRKYGEKAKDADKGSNMGQKEQDVLRVYK